MVRARFDQILLGRKQREGWRRANSINAIRKYHILENPAMRLEGKKEQLRAEWGGGSVGKQNVSKSKWIQLNCIKYLKFCWVVWTHALDIHMQWLNVFFLLDIWFVEDFDAHGGTLHNMLASRVPWDEIYVYLDPLQRSTMCRNFGILTSHYQHWCLMHCAKTTWYITMQCTWTMPLD